MPIGKKQLQRLIRLVAQLKENRYPNCTSFAEEMRKADIEENLNLMDRKMSGCFFNNRLRRSVGILALRPAA